MSEVKKQELLDLLKLKEMGFMQMDLNKFEESTSHENRIIAFSGQGDDKKVFVVGSEKLSNLGFNYKDCLDELLDMKIYQQKINKDKLEIDSEDNMNLLEKYESSLTAKNMIKNRTSSKSKRSVKGLRT